MVAICCVKLKSKVFVLLTEGELLAQSWTCAYRVEAGKCAYKPSG